MIKRLRVFAGPNGSGKSSIIRKILTTELENGTKLDFGIYVNADDIAQDLIEDSFSFKKYEITFDRSDFMAIIEESGLINEDFTIQRFLECISLKESELVIKHTNVNKHNDKPYERIAQLLADFLRKKLLQEGKKFSFETVFSHSGKVEFLKQARGLGYKVYLYFVSTEHPDINVYRVKEVRVKDKGHDVEKDKIKSRYYRSMDLLFEAAQNCYQAYFFDNSSQGGEHTMFAHFKVNAEGKKIWDQLDKKYYPLWFKKYYSAKINLKN